MRTFAAVATLLFIALAPARPAHAIVGGMPDGDGHPNVGLLAFDVDGAGPAPPFVLCTGSVISDSAFLTAAHCIAVAPAAQWSVTLAPGSPADPVTDTGTLWDDFPFAVRVPVTSADEVVVHPEADLAVLRFAPGTFAVEPVALPGARHLDRAFETGEELTLVGYGTGGHIGAGRFPFLGHRRTVSVPMIALTPRYLRFLATAAGGACYGDSGSPQLLDGVAVSIFAGGPPMMCRGAGRGERLDTARARAFLEPFVE